jgi:hypothetical protein
MFQQQQHIGQGWMSGSSAPQEIIGHTLFQLRYAAANGSCPSQWILVSLWKDQLYGKDSGVFQHGSVDDIPVVQGVGRAGFTIQIRVETPCVPQDQVARQVALHDGSRQGLVESVETWILLKQGLHLGLPPQLGLEPLILPLVHGVAKGRWHRRLIPQAIDEMNARLSGLQRGERVDL